MVAIKFKCHACGKMAKVPEEFRGAAFRCPYCRTPRVVQAEVHEESTAGTADLMEVLPADEKAPARKVIRLPCPFCNGAVQEGSTCCGSVVSLAAVESCRDQLVTRCRRLGLAAWGFAIVGATMLAAGLWLGTKPMDGFPCALLVLNGAAFIWLSLSCLHGQRRDRSGWLFQLCLATAVFGLLLGIFIESAEKYYLLAVGGTAALGLVAQLVGDENKSKIARLDMFLYNQQITQP